MSFERRLRIWLGVLGLPGLLFCGLLLHSADASLTVALAALGTYLVIWLIAASSFTEQILRPLQTLANVVAALREDDFSFRARGARRGDALGDLALEVNALAGTLQAQRSSALEALTLAERVMSSMQSPVLAFDAQNRLRLHNAAADRAFALRRPSSDGQTATDLDLEDLLSVADQDVYSDSRRPGTATRYAVRRTAFRLRGMPHVLLVLSDVGAALREEERLAWQRLIRVLGHEINNSLTPIKSIAGSLLSRLPEIFEVASLFEPGLHRDLGRGLAVIEDRAASLNRFLQAYQQLSTLPTPQLASVPLLPLLERVAHLEQRIRIHLAPGPELTLAADPDQLQQALINLVQNATDAAIEAALHVTLTELGPSAEPTVSLAWSTPEPTRLLIQIRDNGLGLLNPVNLFVPFYTTKPNGTGIGLTLAQQILLLHKGTVTLANRTDARGCIAEVQLPLI